MKKILTNILLISILLTNISACSQNIIKKTITADSPYYSVTTGSFKRYENAYMNLDIKIPKITYSNNGGNELIDSLNNDIESSLNTLIDEAMENALNTYKTYLQSAKDNVKKDIENKIAEIESKYQSVIGQEEKDMLSKLSADDISNFSFSNMGRMNTFPNRMASFSNAMPGFRRRFNSGFKSEENNIEETVSGHTSSGDIINPALHNKKIIVVETTTAAQTETTIKISGRPGIAPSEDSNSSSSDKSDRPKRASWSNGQEKNPERNFKATNSELSRQATKSEITKSNEITIENFYRDLRKIRRYYVPDDYSLTIQYIPTTIECGYEIKCLDEDYLSLFVELTESRTTSSVKRLFYNVDLNKMKIISLKDVLGDKYKETSVKSIQDAIDKWSDEQKSTLIKDYNIDNYINENTPFFINNNHRPVIEIEKFAITIGSTGYHEFQIS